MFVTEFQAKKIEAILVILLRSVAKNMFFDTISGQSL